MSNNDLTPANKAVWALLVVAVTGLAGYALWKRTHPPEPDLAGENVPEMHSGTDAPKLDELRPMGRVTGFSLKDQDGATVDAKDLRGHVWIANFIFTRCAGTCPVMTRTMAEIDKELAAFPGINLISFSMDPEHDSPAVLKKYAQQFEATSPRWKFLTGAKSDLYRITIDDFKLGVTEKGGTKEEPIIHDTRFVLVDAEGVIRGYFGSSDGVGIKSPKLQALIAGAKKLAGQKKIEGKGELGDEAGKGAVGPRGEGKSRFSYLATVNASLNALSFVFLMFGYAAIKRGAKDTHKRWMTSAGLTTVVFLACYLTYHYLVGHVEFKGEGVVRYLYLIILFTHVVLAATIAVMIPITFRRAFKEQWESHKKIAKITFPMWVYVSVTGVIVYVMVYHLYK